LEVWECFGKQTATTFGFGIGFDDIFTVIGYSTLHNNLNAQKPN